MRIGAVNYLNSKPLVCGLQSLAPDARISYDLPSRLADSLKAGRLDAALIPVVEYFRTPGQRIVSDACVACRGAVLSVKLLFRVPPRNVRRVALDEGSRTSAALTKILLAELCEVHPMWEPLPIGCGPESTDADAILLIGDRAISEGGCGQVSDLADSTSASVGQYRDRQRIARFAEQWDLGQRWCEWTGLPFVFAAWVANDQAGGEDFSALSTARDQGLGRLDEIAKREAPPLGIPVELATLYFRDNLHFTLGRQEAQGLCRFYQLCVAHGLAPAGLEKRLEEFEFARAWQE